MARVLLCIRLSFLVTPPRKGLFLSSSKHIHGFCPQVQPDARTGDQTSRQQDAGCVPDRVPYRKTVVRIRLFGFRPGHRPVAVGRVIIAGRPDASGDLPGQKVPRRASSGAAACRQKKNSR